MTNWPADRKELQTGDLRDFGQFKTFKKTF